MLLSVKSTAAFNFKFEPFFRRKHLRIYDISSILPFPRSWISGSSYSRSSKPVIVITIWSIIWNHIQFNALVWTSGTQRMYLKIDLVKDYKDARI